MGFLFDASAVRLNHLCMSALLFLGGLNGDSSRLNVTPAQRDNIRISYEFALNHVGQDKDSGQIWSDYIQFLKSGEVCFCGISLKSI